MRRQLRSDAGKIPLGILIVPAGSGSGKVQVADHPAAAGGFVHQHLVVLPAQAVQTVLPVRDQNALFKILPVEPARDDGELGRGVAVQRVQQLSVQQKQRFLILLACCGVVDVGKLPSFAVLILADLKNPVLPNRLDGNGVLYAARNAEPFSVPFQNAAYGFTHFVSTPPF